MRRDESVSLGLDVGQGLLYLPGPGLRARPGLPVSGTVTSVHSEMFCPFCGHRQPFMGGTYEFPARFEGYGDLDFDECPCGAVGSPVGESDQGDWPFDELQHALCRGVLKRRRWRCRVHINHVTHTDPTILVVWAKRR